MGGDRNSPIVAEINSLISDFLQRHSDESQKSANGDNTRRSLTLETVYNYYRTHHVNIQLPGQENALGIKVPLPVELASRLGNEIVFHIIQFLGAADQWKLRLVSRNWNELACQRLRHSKHNELDLSGADLFLSFVAIMLTRGPTIPFGIYKFPVSVFRKAESLMSFFGMDISTCILKMDKPTAPLPAILKMMPNLKNLEIRGSAGLDWIQFDTQIQSSLRSFKLQPESASEEKVTLDMLRVWISGNRFLQSFEIGFILELDSQQEFFEFLRTSSHLRSIELLVRFVRSNVMEAGNLMASPLPGAPRLKLHLAPNQADNTLVSLWLKYLAPYTVKLKLSISDSVLELNSPREHLDTLHLTISESSAGIGRFLPEHFPSLRRVYIRYVSGGPSDGISFRGNVFPTVETLHLVCAFIEGGDGKEDWGGVFPNVINFRLEGLVNDAHLQATVRIFPKLRHLNLSSFEQSNFAFQPFTLERVANLVGDMEPLYTWPLASLKELRTLEIVGFTRKLLLEVAALTKLGVIPELGYLGFFKGDWQEEELSVLGRTLFETNNRHEQVEFGAKYNRNWWG